MKPSFLTPEVEETIKNYCCSVLREEACGLILNDGTVIPAENIIEGSGLTDGEKLLNWLRYQPMIFHENHHVMVHAGLLPQWRVDDALLYAKEVEDVLRSENYLDFLKAMYGNRPTVWHADLDGMDRLRMITNAMTRLRVCSAEGEMEFSFKGELTDIPENFMPWFDVPNRASKDSTIIFGHWSALGLQSRNNVYALDTGCLWGGQLTALNLETKQISQVPCNVKDAPIIGAHEKS